MDLMEAIESYESSVRSYVRNFPAVFDQADGSYLYDVDGRPYLDFFAGASVLNYGHNHPELQKELVDYLTGKRVVHSLDLASRARAEFLIAFNDIILGPRGLRYQVQFPGPTGTNAVESALKITRKVKGRERIVSFTNAFHGMTLGALTVTGNAFKRAGAGMPLTYAYAMPFEGFFGPDVNTLDYLEKFLAEGSSGVDQPAGVIVETIQAEGGVNVASMEWLQGLEKICRQFDLLLIVDDIQAGCGRTGRFFSFEEAGIEPDIVCVSKSISGYGLPLALTLVKEEYDIWEPGEHNGTFRGFNPAMVTAKRAFEVFWSDDAFSETVKARGQLMREGLERLTREYPEARGCVRGRGMMQAIEFADRELARSVCRRCFAKGLIIETAGAEDEVLKLLPPLTTDEADLKKGMSIIEEALTEALRETGAAS
ncbi:MAG: diaminobutyrate--2-oxoglutarate transaminase [Ectothiorhodospiraceae bacterium]|jgi:diaminobutyrate-2-oxoglutarate transaminase